jgi:hypothetical protein
MSNLDHEVNIMQSTAIWTLHLFSWLNIGVNVDYVFSTFGCLTRNGLLLYFPPAVIDAALGSQLFKGRSVKERFKRIIVPLYGGEV